MYLILFIHKVHLFIFISDLAAVYKHDILILPDADLILPDSPISWDTLSLTLPTPLSYPVGLTHDSLNNRLFVAEAKPKEKRKIMSLSLNDRLEVVEMVPAVKSESYYYYSFFFCMTLILSLSAPEYVEIKPLITSQTSYE